MSHENDGRPVGGDDDVTLKAGAETVETALRAGRAESRCPEIPWVLASDIVVMRPGTRPSSGAREPSSQWLNYREAAQYTGYSVTYLRNLVSLDSIPYYGPPRSRRFRRDVLDSWMTDRDAAMRKFRLERQAQRGS